MKFIIIKHYLIADILSSVCETINDLSIKSLFAFACCIKFTTPMK